MPVPFAGRAGRAHAYRMPNTAPSIRGEPQSPPVFASLPATWSPTLTIRNLARAKWAVFQVSATGVRTSDMLWQEFDVPANGQYVPNATIKNARDRLVVRSLDDKVEWESGGAVVNLPAPTQTGGAAHARAFVGDLTVGLNVNRDRAILNGYMTAGRLADYKARGVTHMRVFGPWGYRPWGNELWPDLAGGAEGWLFEFGDRVLAASMKLLIAGMDVQFADQMNDGRTMPHIQAFARRIAARGWDVNKYAVGAINEYGGGTNAEHRAKMHEAARTIRAELPNSLILVAGAVWNDPERLGGFGNNGDPNDPFVPPPNDDRVLVEWHKYADEAHTLATAQWYQGELAAFSQRTGLTTICGEYQRGPADGGNGIVADQAYLRWSEVISASSKGMGQQRVTFWTLDGDPYSNWRANKPGTGELNDDVARELPIADAHIRAQTYFQAAPAGGGGGGGTAPAPAPSAPASNQVPKIQILHRGQSNAYFADSSGGVWALRDTLAALVGVPVDLVSRKETADDSTLFGGTSSFWQNPYSDWNPWLDAAGDYGSAPSGWGVRSPLQGALNAVSRFVAPESNVPLLDLVLHWEYDIGIFDGVAKAAYREAAWEIPRRLRAARAKDPGKHVTFQLHCPYQGGSWDALDTVHKAWAANFADASRYAFPPPNMMDATSRDGGPHWDDASAQRIYPRLAFQLAAHAFRQGWLPSGVDLADCPTRGPRMASAARAGNSLNVTVEHDKGNALLAGADGIDWDCFHVVDAAGGNPMGGTGGAIVNATTVRVDFPSPPPAGGTLYHCFYPNHRGRNVIRDNWHAVRPAKYASVPNVAAVEFPLRRNSGGGTAYG